MVLKFTEKEKAQIKPIMHSNFKIKITCEAAWTSINDSCYAGVRSNVEEVTAFVKVDCRDRTFLKYYEYLVNSPMFGEVFLTKDVKEGMKYGFAIDTTKQAAHCRAAMITFRSPIEDLQIKERFKRLIKLGARVETAFYFSHVLIHSGTSLYPRNMVGHASILTTNLNPLFMFQYEGPRFTHFRLCDEYTYHIAASSMMYERGIDFVSDLYRQLPDETSNSPFGRFSNYKEYSNRSLKLLIKLFEEKYCNG